MLRFCHARQRVRRWPLAGCQPLRLPETLGIAGYGGIAPPVALLLEAMKDLQGVMATTVPELEDKVFVGVQNAVPAPFIGALRKGGTPQIAKDRTLGNVQLVRNGLPGPALTGVTPKSARDAPAVGSGCGPPGAARCGAGALGGTGTITVPSGCGCGVCAVTALTIWNAALWRLKSWGRVSARFCMR